MSDWYYDQGAPAIDEEDPNICSECEYTYCQCDATADYQRGN